MNDLHRFPRENEFITRLSLARYEACDLELQNGFDIDIRHLPSCWPLEWAFKSLRLEAASYLLRNKANSRLIPFSGVPLLVSALKSGAAGAVHSTYADGRCSKLIDLAVEHGMPWDVLDDQDNTLLHLAARSGLHQTASNLLARGADANAINGYRQTPFHLAAQMGREQICTLLLQHGADILAKSATGATAAKVAEIWKNDHIASNLLARESARQAELAIDELMGWGSFGESR